MRGSLHFAVLTHGFGRDDELFWFGKQRQGGTVAGLGTGQGVSLEDAEQAAGRQR